MTELIAKYGVEAVAIIVQIIAEAMNDGAVSLEETAARVDAAIKEHSTNWIAVAKAVADAKFEEAAKGG